MKLHFRSPHELPLDDLRKRVDARVAHYAQRYPNIPIAQSYRWRDERTVVGGYRGGEGTIQLGDRDVTVELDLPFFARPFKGRIEDFVRREMDAVLKG